MEFVGDDLCHFGGYTWLLFVDFFTGKQLVRNFGKHSSTDKIIKRLHKWFLELKFVGKMRCDGGQEFNDQFKEWC